MQLLKNETLNKVLYLLVRLKQMILQSKQT